MGKLTEFLFVIFLAVVGVGFFAGLNYLLYVSGEPRAVWFWGLVGGYLGG